MQCFYFLQYPETKSVIALAQKNQAQEPEVTLA